MQSRRESITEFKKALIGSAALRLFSERPYEDVSVDSIAQEAEIAKGTLYYYFKSKDEILAYVICQGIETLCDAIALECRQNHDVLATLTRVIELQYLYYLQYNPLFMALLRCESNGKVTEQLMEPIRDKHREKQALVAKVLAQGMEQKLLNQADADHLAWGMEYAIKGFGLMRMENKCQDKGDENLYLLQQILLRGIMTREG